VHPLFREQEVLAGGESPSASSFDADGTHGCQNRPKHWQNQPIFIFAVIAKFAYNMSRSGTPLTG
jgi:hypothetical protein